nr:MOSC domain-containing protein [Paraburkholderia sp. BL17N1]
MPDSAVCVGDRYQIGSALFEVTQPGVTCYRVGMRMNEQRMPALLTSSGRPGFCFRVLQEGEVGAGEDIVKVGVFNGPPVARHFYAAIRSRVPSRRSATESA